MALTQEHMAWRNKGIGGSDARKIAEGTAKDWHQLKDEKINNIQPVFTKETRLLMDMGSAVESVILEYLHNNITQVSNRNVPITMPADPYFRCTLDGLTAIGQPIQAKFHTGDKNIEELVEYYYAQLQHELLVTGEKTLVMAVGFGHYGRFEHELVAQDRVYQDGYMMKALQFKEFCWGNAPLPADLAEGESVAIPMNIPRLRDHVWPTNSNEIASLAADWIGKAEAAKAWTDAAAGIKKAVPDDCRSASWLGADGIGIKVTINKAGAKSIKLHTKVTS